jgi:hypothetical protein
VIVLNDDHNTFQGVAYALSSVLPGVSYDKGMLLANRIHDSGQAIARPGAGCLPARVPAFRNDEPLSVRARSEAPRYP